VAAANELVFCVSKSWHDPSAPCKLKCAAQHHSNDFSARTEARLSAISVAHATYALVPAISFDSASVEA
jgi:hypothetical protein